LFTSRPYTWSIAIYIVKFDFLQTNSPLDHHFAVLPSVLDPHQDLFRIQKGIADPNPGRQKLSPKKEKKLRNIMFEEFFIGIEASTGA
jgi:hypothetical protein